jgi:peptidyl-prolyl cis-trans isomerase B (cyclophilin B)
VAPSKNTEREAREARDRLRRYNARQTVHSTQVKRRTRDNVVALVVLVVVAALATVTQIFYFSSGPGAPKAVPTAKPSASASAAAGQNVGDVPPKQLGGGRTWTGTLTLNSTKLGITLDGTKAPQAVSSVVNDIQTKFLDGKACWRLTDSTDFYVLQCGGSSGTDTGGSAYSFGPVENAPADAIYPAGSIVMASTGTAYGEGHQFFITYKTTKIPAPSGIAGYAIVGKVTSGLAALNSQITSKGVKPSTSQDGSPAVPTKITSVTIK